MKYLVLILTVMFIIAYIEFGYSFIVGTYYISLFVFIIYEIVRMRSINELYDVSKSIKQYYKDIKTNANTPFPQLGKIGMFMIMELLYNIVIFLGLLSKNNRFLFILIIFLSIVSAFVVKYSSRNFSILYRKIDSYITILILLLIYFNYQYFNKNIFDIVFGIFKQ